MTGIIPSLLWKEWREQRWKIAYMSFLMVSIVAIGLRTRMLPDITFFIFSTLVGAFLIPIFIGMGLFATEKAEGTLPMLMAIPIQPWKIFIIKISTGAIACLIPFGATLLVVWLLAGNREIETSKIILGYGLCYVFALSFLFWIIGFGITQPNEARTALVGMGIILIWAFIVALEDNLNPRLRYSLIITPFGFLDAADHFDMYFLLKVLAVQTFICIILLYQASTRFTRMRKEKV
jgi:ABC-type transport system involved in multi-copper enzyme maturation permease subunit